MEMEKTSSQRKKVKKVDIVNELNTKKLAVLDMFLEEGNANNELKTALIETNKRIDGMEDKLANLLEHVIGNSK